MLVPTARRAARYYVGLSYPKTISWALLAGHHFSGHSLTGCSNEVSDGVHHPVELALLLLAAEKVAAEDVASMAAEGQR